MEEAFFIGYLCTDGNVIMTKIYFNQQKNSLTVYAECAPVKTSLMQQFLWGFVRRIFLNGWQHFAGFFQYGEVTCHTFRRR